MRTILGFILHFWGWNKVHVQLQTCWGRIKRVRSWSDSALNFHVDYTTSGESALSSFFTSRSGWWQRAGKIASVMTSSITIPSESLARAWRWPLQADARLDRCPWAGVDCCGYRTWKMPFARIARMPFELFSIFYNIKGVFINCLLLHFVICCIIIALICYRIYWFLWLMYFVISIDECIPIEQVEDERQNDSMPVDEIGSFLKRMSFTGCIVLHWPIEDVAWSGFGGKKNIFLKRYQ